MKLLRHRITIERQTTAQNEYGEIINAWSTVGTVSASIEPLNGRELFAAQSVQSEISTRIRLRYLAGMLPSDRITHGGKVYDVLSIINPEMRSIELELMCKSNG